MAVLVVSGTYLPRGLTFGPTNGPEDFQELVFIIFARRLYREWYWLLDDLAIATGRPPALPPGPSGAHDVWCALSEVAEHPPPRQGVAYEQTASSTAWDASALSGAILDDARSVGVHEIGESHRVLAGKASCQLTRPVASNLRVRYFLHLYSGQSRRGELGEQLARLGSHASLRMIVINWDVLRGPEYDLREPSNVQRLIDMLTSGVFAGVHAGPPCATWSPVLWAGG